jgi:hypothetical protein
MREAAELPFIRSMDTSMPYNYAYADKPLLPRLIGQPVSRPKGYFDLTEDEFPMSSVYVDKVLSWANP